MPKPPKPHIRRFLPPSMDEDLAHHQAYAYMDTEKDRWHASLGTANAVGPTPEIAYARLMQHIMRRGLALTKRG